MAVLCIRHPPLLHQQFNQLLHVFCQWSKISRSFPQHLLLHRADQAYFYQLFWNRCYRRSEYEHDVHDTGPELIFITSRFIQRTVCYERDNAM